MQLEQTYELPFSCEEVYSAWISSDTVIPPATAMDINPVVGGHYRLHMKTAEFESHCEGIFSVVEANSRVQYSWEWNNDGNATEIEVLFNETGAGTTICIQHRGFKTQESLDMHASGWDSYVSGLSKFLTHQ